MLTFFSVTSSPSLITTARITPFSQLSHFPTKPHKFNLSFPPLGTQFPIGFSLFSPKSVKKRESRTGFSPFSLNSAKKEEKRTGFSTFLLNNAKKGEFLPFSPKSAKKGENIDLELEDFDYEDKFDEDEDVFDDDDDEDDEGEFVPLRSMKKWLEEKPRGFGDGKEYDTSVEDKLLEEMQQSRVAQLANLNKLKNSSQIANNKNGVGLNASNVLPTGIRVRLSNLPKKKNIDRDLQRAFKGIPGIVNIIPAVSGNKRTREPVCKGFSFVDLKSQDYAHRFAKVVSGQSIRFGKIEKQIKCEVMSSNAQNSELEQSIDTDFGANDGSYDSQDLISSKKCEETNESVVHINLVTTNEPVSDSKPSKQLSKIGAKERKQEAKQKRPKVPRLNVPGSANRLKVREKAMLTGVLSKYAATSSALQEQR